LRQALRDAHDGDTINLAVTGTITLTSGGLPVNKSLTISGPGKDQLSIDGNQALLVFGIFPDKTATISGLTVRNAQSDILNDGTVTVTNCALGGNSYAGLSNYGVATVSSCVLSGNLYWGLYSYLAETTVNNCVVSGNAGGGLFNNVPFGPNNSVSGDGSMTISDSIISDNSGPGVKNYWFLTILNSTLSGNSTDDDGGGISSGTFKSPGYVTVINSTISGNSTSSGGGGIAIQYGGLTIVNSTISGNSAGGAGGAISSTAAVEISNSTISGNSTTDPDYGYGGGISAHSITVSNSTVTGNSAATCGGVCGGTVEIGNTILNANASGNIDGKVTSHGYNISSDDGSGLLTGPGDQINTDPLLGPLRNHGGPTLTHMPMRGSPAIDAGDPNTPPADHDQRGACFLRVFGGRIDVGSVETQPRPRCVTPAPRPTR
jgi:predicted outer membrane repeat protein